jgi:hypothetical protein
MLSFILPLIAIYFLTRKLNFPLSVALLATIFWLSWFHGYFLDGTFISYFAFSFSIFSISFFVDYFKKKKIYSLLLSSIFSALTLLFQSMFFPFLLISLFIFSILKFKIKPFVFLLLLTIPLTSIYLTSVFNWWHYTSTIFSMQPKIFPHQYDINKVFWKHFYILSNFVVLFSLPLIVLPSYKKFNPYLSFLLITSFSLIAITFLLNFIQTNFPHFRLIPIEILRIAANFFLIERIMFFTRSLFCILAAFSVYLTFKLIKNKKLKIFLTSTILALILIIFVSYFHYFWEGWYISDSPLFKYIYDWKLEEWYSLRFENGVLRNEPKKDVIELFNFLKANTNNQARILIEDSRWGKLGGNIMAMASYYTGRFFVGGLHQGVMIPGNTWAVDSIFFGRNITDYKIEELEEKLKLYNVGWIVAWTQTTKNWLDRSPKFKILHETKNKLFRVYAYLDSPMKYVESERSEVELKKLTNDTIVLKIKNGVKNEKLLLKFRYEKEWHAFVDGKEIPIEKRGILMSINLPKDGNYFIMIKYKENNLVKIGRYITFFSFIGIITYLLKKTSLIKPNLFKTAFGFKEKRKLYST